MSLLPGTQVLGMRWTPGSRPERSPPACCAEQVPQRGRESRRRDPTPMQRPRAAVGWGPPLRPLPHGGGSGLSGVTTPVASLLEADPPWDE